MVALLDRREERIKVHVQDRPLGHGRYHRPSVQPPVDDRSGIEPLSTRQVIGLIGAVAVGVVLVWAIPIVAVPLVWPWLFLVPGWVLVRRVAPELPAPAQVGIGVVASTYVSAHLVELVATVGGF